MFPGVVHRCSDALVPDTGADIRIGRGECNLPDARPWWQWRGNIAKHNIRHQRVS